MVTEKYVLYILRVPKQRAIKVGLTSFDRLDRRLSEIEKAFGRIDKKQSFYFTSKSMKDIKNLEKGCHLIFWKSSKTLPVVGSGHTEFFNQRVLKSVTTFFTNLQTHEMKTLSGPIFFSKRTNKLKFILLGLFLLPIIAFATYFFFSKIHI